jgi:hypothetical protein
MPSLKTHMEKYPVSCPPTRADVINAPTNCRLINRYILPLPLFLRAIHTFLSKPPNYGPWCHLLHFPASSVLLLSSRPHVCYHYVFSRDYTFWFAIYRLLVRGFSCVCPPYNLMLCIKRQDNSRRRRTYKQTTRVLYWGCNRRNATPLHLNLRVRFARLNLTPVLMVMVCLFVYVASSVASYAS